MKQAQSAWVRGGFLMIVFTLALVPAPAGAQNAEERHARAIASARDGDYERALRLLKDLARRDPANKRYLYDRAVVLSWAGRDAEALALLPAIDPAEAPAYALEALAKSARNTGDHTQAQTLYRQILQRDAAYWQARLGLALTLVDTRNTGAAFKLLAELLASRPNDPEVLFAYAYALETDKRFLPALSTYERILEITPDSRPAYHGKVLAAAALGASHLAEDLIGAHPDWFTAEERERVAGDRIASHIRWGELEPFTPKQRFAETDRALQQLDHAHGSDWAWRDLNLAHNRRALFDRMVALRDRVRMDEVIAIYRMLQADGVEAPNYALLAAGDAYLYKEQPEQALQCYLRVKANDPDGYNVRLSLFFTYIELDDFPNAYRIIDKLAADNPAWLPHRHARIVKDNPKRLEAGLNAVLARAFADDMGYAEQRFEDMLTLAPANTEIRAELATIYRWRGWLDRALSEHQYIKAIEPELVSNQIGLATAFLQNSQYRLAEFAYDRLNRDYPEHKHVQRLGRAWHVHNRRELLTHTRVGESDGGELGSQEINNEVFLYSQPLDYNYRAYYHDYYNSAVFEEGTGRTHRLGVGLEYRDRRYQINGELSGGIAHNNEVGAALDAQWRYDDYWRFNTLLEVNSNEVPVRGIRVGVNGNRLGAGAAYHWHESQRVSLFYSVLDFDDGNLRNTLQGNFYRRLINLPYFKANGNLNVYASANERDDVIYYSPKSDLGWDYSLELLWRTFRRYEGTFHHRFEVGAGQYYQTDFERGRTWSVSYEHQWKFSDAFRLTYGVVRSRRVFDGDPEFETAFYGGINLRF